MGKKGRKRQEPQQAEPTFEVDPFAGLRVPAEMLSPAPAPAPVVEPVVPVRRGKPDLGAAVPPLWQRIERKGRGGKIVTLVGSFAALDVAEQMEVLRVIKKELGTGGSFENDVLQLQGDQRQTLPTVLTKLGLRLKG